MLLKILVGALCATLCAAGRPSPVHKPRSGLVRPCPGLHSRCIQDNFAANSACSRHVPGVAPPSFTVPRVDFETPFFNASYIDLNLVVKGLDKCFVAEYFYNPLSDNEVIGIECPGLYFESERILYQHFTYKEDVVYSFHIKGTYPLIRLTTTLRHGNGLNICKETTFADVAALPIYKIDPRDQRTTKALTSDLTKTYIYERELFGSRANMLARAYINNVICNFKC